MDSELNTSSVNSVFWKTAQSICSLGVTFLIQLFLARLLSPEDFGILAISTVFLTLANTIIETSFSSSIIQRTSLTQKLMSSIFYTNLFLSLLIYIIIFSIAPAIASFYNHQILVKILRIQGLKVIISSFYTIQQSLLNRKMRFKALFCCSFAGSLFQIITGLTMAYMGFGVWSLVLSTCAGSIVTGILIMLIEPWVPNLFFSFKIVKGALTYSSKILVIRILKKLFYNIRSLTIGRVYNAEVLGLFDKGFQFPSTVMTIIDGSLTSVSFSHLSKLQKTPSKLVLALRQYIQVAMFICFPMMVGLALVAEPLVLVLLTERWIGCVPYLQIICITQLFLPLSLKATAFEAHGRSDISLFLNSSGIVLSTILLFAAIPFSPLAVTFTGIISNFLLQILMAVASVKFLNYSIFDQIKDCFGGLVPTTTMIVSVILLDLVGFYNSPASELIIKIFVAVTTFLITSIVTKNKVLHSTVLILKKVFLRKHK